MLLTVFSSILTLACGVGAFPWRKDSLHNFCFMSDECPDMQFCRNHQCKFPITLEEFRTVTKIHYSRQRQISSEGQACLTHLDCHARGYLCDIGEGMCRRADKVFKKINRCKDFKKSCRSNSDCSCSTHEMKCEAEETGSDRECVIVKPLESAPSSSSSSSSSIGQAKRKASRRNRIDKNKTEQSWKE